ncbi:MAG: class I SAM-dependent methyltransferase [Magnetococcus sp. DMHC-1]|nr:class I SAM-dependent methyltransferase [Magnetococcales bacterium]
MTHYPGLELDLFAQALNWKKYLTQHMAPEIQGSVLEVGAGTGNTTLHLCNQSISSWTCLEPDPNLLAHLTARIHQGIIPPSCKTLCGTLTDLPPEIRFDRILYVDVLEHIQDDQAELQRACSHLTNHQGRLIILSPAHEYLYTPFDAAIGHVRRYDRHTLRALIPPGMVVEKLRYLDSVGLLASLANRLFFRQSMPTIDQIHVWDRLMVPLSRWFDPLLRYRLGKSILLVARVT